MEEEDLQVNPLNFFRQNIFLKILSLVFAIILWFFVVLEDKVEQDVDVFIHYQHVPKGLMLVNTPPNKIHVKVVGPRSILRNLSRKTLSLNIDLSEFERGRHLVVLHPKDIPLPAGLEIIGIQPEKIEIVLERIASRLVPVEPMLEGSPPSGWKLVKVTVIPSKVRIRGPESLVYRIKRLRTKPIDISNLKGEVVRVVELEVPDMLTVLPSALVKVKLLIKEKIVEREIKDLKVNAQGASGPVKLKPSKICVLLRGPERLLGPFAELKIEALVDLRGLKPGQYRLPVKIKLPEGIKIIDVQPKKIIVEITK